MSVRAPIISTEPRRRDNKDLKPFAVLPLPVPKVGVVLVQPKNSDNVVVGRIGSSKVAYGDDFKEASPQYLVTVINWSELENVTKASRSIIKYYKIPLMLRNHDGADVRFRIEVNEIFSRRIQVERIEGTIKAGAVFTNKITFSENLLRDRLNKYLARPSDRLPTQEVGLPALNLRILVTDMDDVGFQHVKQLIRVYFATHKLLKSSLRRNVFAFQELPTGRIRDLVHEPPPASVETATKFRVPSTTMPGHAHLL